MPQPLTIEEREEVDNLAAECESPEKLRAYLAELLRLRALASVCRHHHARLPRAVQQVLENRVPKLSQAQEWARIVGAANDENDPRIPGAPRLI